ncbi:MAG: hypothetical protein RLZZ126_127 [Pseudomonadota bacterium]|jgi:hypothetical protein
MTTASFAHPHFPAEHPGVTRAEAVAAKLQGYGAWAGSARGLAALLVSAMVAGVLAVADQMIDTWADGHLVAAWAFLWALGFLTLVFLGPVVKAYVADYASAVRRHQARRTQAHREAAYLAAAEADPRIMAELRAAILRHEAEVSPAEAADARARIDTYLTPVRSRAARAGYWGHLGYI